MTQPFQKNLLMESKLIRNFSVIILVISSSTRRKAITYFPSPFQVAKTEISVLRTAGLSARKAEYGEFFCLAGSGRVSKCFFHAPVQDLATRFADGRLSTQKLLEADDDELARMLIEVRGIGRVRHPSWHQLETDLMNVSGLVSNASALAQVGANVASF